MNQNEVAVAFDIVLEEIEDIIEELNKEGAHALQSEKYDVYKDLLDKGYQLTTFREKVSDLQKEWVNIFAKFGRRKNQKLGRKVKRSKKARTRLKRGLRTPIDDFREPILRAIVELGGSAPASEILDKVETSMKELLNSYDQERLSSYPQEERWRKTAQWARNSMAREGLLVSDSQRGVWEISTKGRKHLFERERENT